MPVLEQQHVVKTLQPGCDSALTRAAGRPGALLLWFARQRQEQTAEPGMPLRNAQLTGTGAALVLPLR